MGEARVRVSLSDGSFEVEGPVQFVEANIERLKGLLNGPKWDTSPSGQPGKESNHVGGAPPSEDDACAKHFRIPTEKVGRVIHADGSGGFTIIAKLSGFSGDAGKQRVLALAYILAAEFYLRRTKCTFDELRSLCTEHGCLDAAHFSHNFKKKSENWFAVTGSAKNQTLSLTAPGRDKAREVIAELAGES